MAIAKEQVQQILTQNDIQSVSDVYDLMRESFKDILQELLEAEMDASLGYKKNQKGKRSTSNKRNGHSTKILKSQFGEFPVEIPRDRDGEFQPVLIPKYHGPDSSGTSGMEVASIGTDVSLCFYGLYSLQGTG